MDLSQILFIYIVIILSAVIHEYSHGWMADYLGDPTAKRMGRLTLNPLDHIDMTGTVLVPFLTFILPALMGGAGVFIGWAKPVPYNPYNTKDPERASFWVGLAGPLSNLALALIIGFILRFGLIADPAVSQLIALIVIVNIYLFLFNLIPVPPLDGSKVFGKFLPFDIQRGGLGMGLIIALFIAFFILQPLASFIFNLIVGGSFGIF